MIGAERALDLLLSGRTVTADEAMRIGLVSRVVEPDQLIPAVIEYARDIAANRAPGATETIKRQVRTDLDSTYGEALARAYTLTVEASRGAEFREAVEAFTSMRPPQFS